MASLFKTMVVITKTLIEQAEHSLSDEEDYIDFLRTVERHARQLRESREEDQEPRGDF